MIEKGVAKRQGQRVIFARDLLATLRRRELDETAAKLAAENGLRHRQLVEGEPVAGVYRRRLTFSSGCFAMIDDGMGFQLASWRPALEQRLGQEVRGMAAAAAVSIGASAAGVDWASSCACGDKRFLTRPRDSRSQFRIRQNRGRFG